MTRAIILDGNINDNLWPKLVFAITCIKNCHPTKTFNDLSPYKVHFYK